MCESEKINIQINKNFKNCHFKINFFSKKFYFGYTGCSMLWQDVFDQHDNRGSNKFFLSAWQIFTLIIIGWFAATGNCEIGTFGKDEVVVLKE